MAHAVAASTEPPTVIGGESATGSLTGTGALSGFNGAADGDRRRVALAEREV